MSDVEILVAYRELAATEGVFVEPASAASVAGLRKAVRARFGRAGRPRRVHRHRPWPQGPAASDRGGSPRRARRGDAGRGRHRARPALGLPQRPPGGCDEHVRTSGRVGDRRIGWDRSGVRPCASRARSRPRAGRTRHRPPRIARRGAGDGRHRSRGAGRRISPTRTGSPSPRHGSRTGCVRSSCW